VIADALDEPGELALGAAAGFAAGLAGALVMLACLAVWYPSGVSGPRDVLAAIGAVVLGGGAAAGPRVAVGIVMHGGLGGALGVLYGICQHRVPLRGLAVTGLFHGVIIWVGSNVVARAGFAAPVRSLVHSRPWLLGCLVYGLALAAAAAVAERRRPAAGLRPAAVD
jgi:hypothetical protein